MCRRSCGSIVTLIDNFPEALTCNLCSWVTSFERENLTFSVHRREGLSSVVQELVETKRRVGELEPTLIYTNTTGQVDEVANYLERTGLFTNKVSRCGQRSLASVVFIVFVDFIELGLQNCPSHTSPTSRYHGKMSLTDRRNSHTSFLMDDSEVMVATVAYGKCTCALDAVWTTT